MTLIKGIIHKNADTQSGSSSYTVKFARSSIRAERLTFEIDVYGFKTLVDVTV